MIIRCAMGHGHSLKGQTHQSWRKWAWCEDVRSPPRGPACRRRRLSCLLNPEAFSLIIEHASHCELVVGPFSFFFFGRHSKPRLQEPVWVKRILRMVPRLSFFTVVWLASLSLHSGPLVTRCPPRVVVSPLLNRDWRFLARKAAAVSRIEYSVVRTILCRAGIAFSPGISRKGVWLASVYRGAKESKDSARQKLIFASGP